MTLHSDQPKVFHPIVTSLFLNAKLPFRRLRLSNVSKLWVSRFFFGETRVPGVPLEERGLSLISNSAWTAACARPIDRPRKDGSRIA